MYLCILKMIVDKREVLCKEATEADYASVYRWLSIANSDYSETTSVSMSLKDGCKTVRSRHYCLRLLTMAMQSLYKRHCFQ
jgi:hypothetical protein